MTCLLSASSNRFFQCLVVILSVVEGTGPAPEGTGEGTALTQNARLCSNFTKHLVPFLWRQPRLRQILRIRFYH